MKVNEKDYKASHFGKEDMTAINKEYVSREFWRLENSYDDFKNNPKTGDVLPYNNYPMLIEKGQVFAIDYTKADGSVNKDVLPFRRGCLEWSALNVGVQIK